MPDAVAVSVAKAVEAHITAAVAADAFHQSFTLERSYADWDLELKEAEGLRVDVALVTTKHMAELAARGGKLAYTVPVDVAVRRRFGRDNQNDDTGRVLVSKVDELMLLVEQLHEQFTQQRLTDPLTSVWKEDPKILVAPSVKHLRDMKMFYGLVRLAFRTDKAL